MAEVIYIAAAYVFNEWYDVDAAAKGQKKQTPFPEGETKYRILNQS